MQPWPNPNRRSLSVDRAVDERQLGELEVGLRARPWNWRSFTGMGRQGNANSEGPGAGRELAFVYRNRAEKERQLREGQAGGLPSPFIEASITATIGLASFGCHDL